MLQGLSPKPLSMWKHPLRKASLRTHRKTPQPDLPTRSHSVSGASFPTPWLRAARPEIATFLAAIFEVTFFATILRQSWHHCSLCLWFRLWCCSRCFCFHFGLWFGQSLRFCLRCCCLNSNRRLRSSCFTCLLASGWSGGFAGWTATLAAAGPSPRTGAWWSSEPSWWWQCLLAACGVAWFKTALFRSISPGTSLSPSFCLAWLTKTSFGRSGAKSFQATSPGAVCNATSCCRRVYSPSLAGDGKSARSLRSQRPLK